MFVSDASDDHMTETYSSMGRFMALYVAIVFWLYISSVYSSFSDRVGLPLHNIPSLGVLMKSIGAEFLRLDALPGVHHMRGMQYQIIISIAFCPELN